MRSRLVSLLVVLALASTAQTKVATRIGEILKEWNQPDTPGAAVAVIQDGKIVFQEGYGIAHLEYGIPITPDTVFHVASVSKQFTAMALVLLEQDGKLSLNDTIHKYLPELPDYGRPIAIRALLQHTSGIRDQWQTLALAGWRLDDVITQKQILGLLFRQRELNFEPGAEFLYPNGGYTLGAEIVARVSGKSFPVFCEERIFKPAGMTRTHFHDDHRRIVKGRAYSYSKTGSGYQASPLNYANAGATSLFTTAPDLARWLDNFREPKSGSRAAMNRLLEQGMLTSGKKIDYALGVSVSSYRGLKTVSHGGGDAGYRSYALWFPDHRVGVAVLGNAGNFNPGAVTNRIAEVFLEEKMDPAAAKPKAPAFQTASTPVDAAKYAGFYAMSPGFTIQFEFRDGKLFGAPPGQPKSELKFIAPGKFYVPSVNAEVEFSEKPRGGMALTMKQGGVPVEGERVAIEPFDPAELSRYAGVYWSDELETQYRISLHEDKLVAQHVRHGEITLTPFAKDLFRGGEWFLQEARFTRDAAGRVTQVTLGGGRVRGIRFFRRQ